MKIEFTKMTGAGNDFVVIDNRWGLIKDGPAIARSLCDRRWGVGADGLLLIEPSARASYKMMYYNADGSYGGMCGNGGRCLAQFAFVHTLADAEHDFEALDYVYNASVSSKLVMLTMKSPKDLKLNLLLPNGNKRIKAHYVDTGSPHLVIPVSQLKRDVDSVPVVMMGRKFRYEKKFLPDGTNVNFVQKIDTNRLRIRTYERGVEDETLACGTGSIASAIIAHAIWAMEPPITVVPKSGVELGVDFQHAGRTYRNVRLTGPATILFTGSIDI